MERLKSLEIKKGHAHQRFCVGEDTNLDEEIVVGILYVPHVDYADHSHIELNIEEAKQLYKWLEKFLEKYET